MSWDEDLNDGELFQTINTSVGRLTTFPISQSDTVNLPIPDNDSTGIDRTLTLGDPDGTITAFKVNLDISHPFIGDLLVTIEAPNGSTATLFNSPGQTGVDLVGTYTVNSFVGMPATGEFTIHAEDRQATDAGTFNSWGIEGGFEAFVCSDETTGVILYLLGLIPEEPAMDCNGDGVINAADAVEALNYHP